ncbi:MAG: DNA polymerase III subunit delta, partial [bacterium]
LRIDKRLRIPDLIRMAQVSYAAALQKLELGKVEPRYLLLGEEYYQQFLLTEKVVKACLPPGQRAYGKTELAGQKANPQALQEALNSVPLLGGNTVVVVNALHRVPAAGQEYLMKALPRLDPTVTFIGIAKKLDGRTKLGKGLAALCATIKLKELSNQQLPGYVQSRFQARGITLADDAITEVCRVVGRDCGDIENEVEKISITFADRDRLALADVRSYLAASRQFGHYEVASYLGNRKLATAIKGVQQVLATGGSGARSLFWAISGQLEKLLLYPELAKSLSLNDLAGKLRSNTYYLKDYERQSNRWQPEELVAALEEVYQVAAAERFGTEPPAQIWERALLRILGSEPGE